MRLMEPQLDSSAQSLERQMEDRPGLVRRAAQTRTFITFHLLRRTPEPQ